MSDTSPPAGEPDSTDKWGDAFRDLIGSPARVALYVLLLGFVTSIVVRFELPGEFWAALTGLLTGITQANRDKT